MTRIITSSILFITAAIALLSLPLYLMVRSEYSKLASDDPKVWESTIRKFESEDKENPPPHDAVLFVGSSSIRFWRNLQDDFPMTPVIKRGFGGAKMNDLNYYFDRIIYKYKPSMIVLFAGTNDISGRKNDKTPEQLLMDFQELATKIRMKLPETKLIYLPITPTISRWSVWPEANKANQLIHKFIMTQSHMTYVETDQYFLNDQGLPRKDLFWWDGTHLNHEGYEIWIKLIDPLLVEIEFQK